MINLDITDYTPEELNEICYQEDIAEEQLDSYVDSWFQNRIFNLTTVLYQCGLPMRRWFIS